MLRYALNLHDTLYPDPEMVLADSKMVSADQGRVYHENWGRNVTRNVIYEKRILLLSNVFQKKRCVSIAY